MRSVSVFTTLFAAAASAQSSVVNFLVQDSDNGPDDLVASLVSAGPSLTTYVMNCQPTLDADDCGWGPGATFTVGSTTMDMVLTDTDFTWSAHCSYSATSATAAVCTNIYSGSEANDPGTEIDNYDGSDGNGNGTAPWAAITITAGLDAVATSAAGSGSASATGSSTGVVNTASTSASASGSSSSSAKDTTTGSVSGSVSGSATAKASSASASASSSTSTGGVPQVTSVSFALGGAAMLMAMIAL